ncbi:MAG TPA: hypothetical protein PLY68_02395 [Myxococcota bacterium]|nr:hypothetical protein [Myxococcota bacterium]HQP95029.1 hypothetical protein [Myxococcota bacterium]
MTRCLRMSLPVLILFSGLLSVTSCGRGPGVDSDGDGLSDLQELLFGTGSSISDTDNDGVPDGRDDDPLSGDPQIRLTASPAFENEDGDRCVIVGFRVLDGRGFGLGNAKVSVSWELGALGEVTTDDTGSGRLTACSPHKAETVLKAESQNLGGRVDKIKASIDLSFKHLAVPGVNTEPDQGAGPANGHVKVTALQRTCNGALRPFEGASVFVDAGTGSVPFQTTGPAGVVEFFDSSLVSSYDVTVGAPGHRYVTYLGISGASVSVVLDPLDVVASDAASGFGQIEGLVSGFLGEGGLEPLPSSSSLIGDDRIAVAIVSTAINGRPLSSMSMGSVLEKPGDGGVPGNMPLCLYSDPVQALKDNACKYAVFTLSDVPAGQHLVFALGGTVADPLTTISDPYKIDFRPLALGIARVNVKPGQVNEADILMNIDLSSQEEDAVQMYLGNLPTDYKTGAPMPNALAMPVIDTGGEGFIFVSINGDYNREGFQNPIEIKFPDPDDPVLKNLGLRITNLAVGLAGRASYKSGDPPGISTPVRPGVEAGDTVHLDSPSAWLELPELLEPAVVPPDRPLDTVSPDLFTGEIRWRPVSNPVSPDLYILRLNYLTSAVENRWFVDGEGKFGTLGGPRSHALWEFFVPPDRSSVTLPVFPEGFPTPYLGNPEPTPPDSRSPHFFDADTIEVELSAYVLGADGKPFDYSSDFEYNDVNMHCTVVSQESVPVRMGKQVAR